MAKNKVTTTEMISVLLALDIPCIVWGGPGTGKSSMVKAIAKELGVEFQELMGNTLEPTDVTGPREKITFQDDPGKVYSIGCEPAWVHKFRGPKKGIIFLDELCTSSIPTMNALLRIVLDRKVGETSVNALIVAASNFAKDTLGNNGLQQALANRFCHIEVTEGSEEWFDNMRTNWSGSQVPAVPGKVDDLTLIRKYVDILDGYRKSIPSVNNWRGFEGHEDGRYWTAAAWPRDMVWPAPDPDEVETPYDYAFPTRRSLQQALRIYAFLDGHPNRELAKRLVVGCIGMKLGEALDKYVNSVNKFTYKLADHLADFEKSFNLDDFGAEAEATVNTILSEIHTIPEARRASVFNHLRKELEKDEHEFILRKNQDRIDDLALAYDEVEDDIFASAPADVKDDNVGDLVDSALEDVADLCAISAQAKPAATVSNAAPKSLQEAIDQGFAAGVDTDAISQDVLDAADDIFG